ncbi:MAG: hypothetical protein LCH34_11590 [Firmicutes bacterium]|nr:hypothetical protein [Bacillota bacterium]
MKSKEEIKENLKSSLSYLAKALMKFVLKVIILVFIGAALSFIVHYIKDYPLATVMRVVGVIIAFLGVGSMSGASGLRNDYNYNMAKMRDSKLLNLEHTTMFSDSMSFTLWMGTSGVLLILLASFF